MQITPSEAAARAESGRAGAARDLGDLIVVDPMPGDVAQQRWTPSGETLRWRMPPAAALAPREAPEAGAVPSSAEVEVHPEECS